MGVTLTRLTVGPSGYGQAMTDADPTHGVGPTNVQVYEGNPDSVSEAALDQRSGRRLPIILVAVLAVLLLVALGRRRQKRKA
jgi:hypothetical protein